MNPIGSIERDTLEIIYLMNETMGLATDCIIQEQEITGFLARSGRNGGFRSNLYTPFYQIMHQFLHGGKMAPVSLLHDHYSFWPLLFHRRTIIICFGLIGTMPSSIFVTNVPSVVQF